MGSVTGLDSTPSVRPAIYTVFDAIRDNITKTAIGHDRWYILTAAALVGGNDPELCDQLYIYLRDQPEFSTPAQRRVMIRRLREALFKCISIIGVCKPLEAIMAINQQERDEDKDRSPATREGWQCDDANMERGMGWMRKVYTSSTDSTLGFFDDHKDFDWVTRHITYGMYLSDRQVLDDLDTEVVVLSDIMIQNLRKETHWHIRGIRRGGVSSRDTQVVWDSVQSIAAYLGMKLHRVPSVAEVEHDV